MPGAIIKLEGGHSIHLRNKNATEIHEALSAARQSATAERRWQWFDGPRGQVNARVVGSNALVVDSYAVVAVINDGRGI